MRVRKVQQTAADIDTNSSGSGQMAGRS